MFEIIRLRKSAPVFLRFLAGLFYWALTQPVHAIFDAGLINVDLESSSPRQYSGAAVLGQTGDIWNASQTFTINPVPLRFSDGSPSSVTLQPPIFQGPFGQFGFGGFIETSSPMALGPFGALMSDGFGGGLITLDPPLFTLSGLSPGSKYEVFAYSYYRGLASTNIYVGGATATVVNPVGLDSLVEGQSYAHFSSAAANANGNLVIGLGSVNFNTPMALNGFQIRPIAPVPELGTLGIGILLFGWCASARGVRHPLSSREK